MSHRIEVPALSELDGLALDVEQLSEGVVSITASANDGDTVVFVWDEMHGSVFCRWSMDATERLTVTRETAKKVTVRADEKGRVEFQAWFDTGETTGSLLVEVGDVVRVIDTLLRG